MALLSAFLVGTHASAEVESRAHGTMTWKVGVARQVITPRQPVWLAGYGWKRAPEGKLHDLWVKALALEDAAGKRAVLITSDLQGIPRAVSLRMFARLEREVGLARHQAMITFSHNHCGPRLGTDLVDYYPADEAQVELVEEYTALIEEQTVALVRSAFMDLQSATLGMGEGRATFAVNRRNNPEAFVPSLIAAGETLKGPVDHAVPVLEVKRLDGSVAAILFGYACHPTTLNVNLWCGDYPGFAQLALEQRHPGATAMFINTCGGDQNPIPRRTVELCERYGQQLATGVEEALRGPLVSVSSRLSTAYQAIELPYLNVVTREELRTYQNDTNAIRARWAARMLGKLEAGETFAGSHPYPLHAWRLGSEMLLIGMGGEVVVDYALRFKRAYGAGTWVCGYADELVAYIPSRRVWEEGGYEGGSYLYEYGHPALRWSGDVEARIVASVHRLVAAVTPGRQGAELLP